VVGQLGMEEEMRRKEVEEERRRKENVQRTEGYAVMKRGAACIQIKSRARGYWNRGNWKANDDGEWACRASI